MRALAAIPLVMIALLAIPNAARAAGPVRESAVSEFEDAGVFGSCDGYDLLATDVRIDRTTLTWFDGNGEPIREQRQVHFYFTLTNSVSGTVGQYIGHFARPADYVAGTDALMGAYRQLFIDHRNVWSASGRDALLDDGSVVSNGRMSLLQWEEGLCDAMA